MTLADLLAEPDLRVSAVTAPAGSSGVIRYVYPTELFDPSNYLRGEELVVSVGVPIYNKPADVVHRYVADLVKNRVTALLVGLGDLLVEAPVELVKECRTQGLPLLTLAPGVPFRRVVDWIDDRRITERTVDARERELGALLRWFVAGTLGVGPIENALTGYGLAGSSVLVCAFPVELHKEVHRLVDEYAGAVAVLEDRILALCAGGAEFSSALADSHLVCGVAVAENAQAMAHAIPEALEALREGVRRRQVVRIEDVATLEGLLAAVPKVRLVPFIHRLIVPLVEYDARSSTDLLASLQVFLRPGSDISTAAAKLYVHVNTLRNRLAKVAELTGANPLDENDRVKFRIAIWAAGNMGTIESADPA
ncbi:helix-turn-helix domain-containing protein [[Mycobacterium] wendilense]|uniref:Helix-turn-helix domain-containing protein n=1 Tax=[Mycobacterium] wendilense TaxID=3064284 RepID=A0ABM9MIA7_9MYCO|nr:PucR family transcriptional regulator ligand-binding domain-containing protein [Mycolicibacterium sp. MU0050]CAJ1585884.1 helix-turn-helix domain-containing protein [Mycolicibacterium sp. MU0050]